MLNKVDLMWDELKSQAEIDRAIQRMVETTAGHLQIAKERIFPISAQKALLGKIRGDAGLVRKSGIEELERYLADEVVPMRRQILCRAVVGEIGGMMASSRAQLAKKQKGNQDEIAELNGLVGKSRDVVTKLWAKITAEKNAYNAALAEYKVNFSQFSAKRAVLQDLLDTARLDAALAKSAQAIQDSWTTVGLQRGMNELVRVMSENFETVFRESEDIKKLMQAVYNTFVAKFGFQKMTIPALDLDPQRTKLQLLVHQTEAFVRDPVNVVVKEKHFVVKNFYNTLVKEARGNFVNARNHTERWLQAVILPLEVQIKDHKAQLQSRLDNLSRINEKTSSIHEQMALLKTAEADLKKQRDMIEGLIERVTAHAATATLKEEAPAAPLERHAPQVAPEMMQTMKLDALEVRPPPAPAKAADATHTMVPAAPLVSDDLMSEVAHLTASPHKAASPPPPQKPPSFDSMATQRMGDDKAAERTQRLDPQQLAARTRRIEELKKAVERNKQLEAQRAAERTQRLDPAPAERTQRIPASDGEKTMQMSKYRPDATRKLTPK